MRNNSILVVFLTLMICAFPVMAYAEPDYSPAGHMTLSQAESTATEERAERRPVLSIAPREIDLGMLQPGETSFAEYTFRNLSPGALEWSISAPDGWEEEQRRGLKSMITNQVDYLRLELTVSSHAENFYFDQSRPTVLKTSLKLEAGGRTMVCHRELRPGAHRLALRVASPGGQRTIFVAFRIVAAQEKPALHLKPQRVDMGTLLPGKTASSKINLTNKGKEMLVWSVVKAKTKRAGVEPSFRRERYVSFFNDDRTKRNDYAVPAYLKNSLEISGKWSDIEGYPKSKGAVSSMKYHFYGTGIRLYVKTHSEEGNLAFYMDDQRLNLHDWFADVEEGSELLLAEGLALGNHTLTIVCREGALEIEGVKILDVDVLRGPQGWMSVFPISGTTTSETDYINVRIDTSGMAPGYYADEILFKSNGGDKTAEVFVEIMLEASSKIMDVYLYSNELDFVFTSNPQAESKRFIQNGYVKEGIAFRLFAPQTPGTTSFYRWFNPDLGDHFYSYDRAGGGKKLDGYVFEGSIGNIATSRMTNTRELYRWVNPSTGRHYYSTNAKGGASLRKGYRFDGIAGYVR
ncbi:MAG: hypothetical protein R6W75_00560 [Smithellaceae bacterium]